MSASTTKSHQQIENHPLMHEYISYYKKLKQLKLLNYTSLWTVYSSILTAPFYTIAISRQLSVTPHKEIYGDYITPKKSKELMKISQELTLRDSRNFELIKSSGVVDGQKPYRAPIYDNYRQTIKGLYNQGILGFYKGNLYRLVTMAGTQRIRLNLEWYLQSKMSFFNKRSFIRDWICLSIADMILHPAFLVESRYILQNRLPQFQIYRSIFTFKSRSYFEMFKGGFGHIPKNFFYLLGFYFYNFLPSKNNFSVGVITGTVFSYPILTAFRRIVCESSSLPGLLPLRYLNLMHAVFLIRREEGFFFGLYKGFWAYIIAVFIWVMMVPSNAMYMYHKQKVEDDEFMLVDDPVFEEIKRRKYANLV